MKRYWLMKLIDYDQNNKLETWKFMNIATEKPSELNNFLFNGYRVYDNKNGKVVKIKLDIDQWLKDNQKRDF